jgi:hypothetical protein
MIQMDLVWVEVYDISYVGYILSQMFVYTTQNEKTTAKVYHKRLIIVYCYSSNMNLYLLACAT